MDILNKINTYYSQLPNEQYNNEYDQFKNRLVNHNIPVNTLILKPYFITKKKRNEFLRITEILLNVFEKLTYAYYKNKEIRNLLSLNGRINDYIDVNPGYTGKQQVARLDGLYNYTENSLQFLEVNLDNPSYIGMNDLFIKIFDQMPSLKCLRKDFNIKCDMLVDSLYEILINKYREYCIHYKKDEREDPHIAVVCSRNSFIRDDVELIVNFLKEKNLNINYADPRDFVYDGETLKLNGEEVHIVYRDTLKDFFRSESSGKIHSKVRNKILDFTKDAAGNNRFIKLLFKNRIFRSCRRYHKSIL